MNFRILEIPNSSSCGYKSIEHCFFLHFDTHIYTCFSLQSSERLNFSLKNADILVQNVHFIEGHCINSGLKSEKNENLEKFYCFLQKLKTFFFNSLIEQTPR